MVPRRLQKFMECLVQTFLGVFSTIVREPIDTERRGGLLYSGHAGDRVYGVAKQLRLSPAEFQLVRVTKRQN